MALLFPGIGMGSDPFREVDRMMNRFLGPPGMMQVPAVTAGGAGAGAAAAGDTWGSLSGGRPVDIVERDDSYEVIVDVPGLSPEDVTVECGESVLTIRGRHARKHDTKYDRDVTVHRSERAMRNFTRAFAMPDNASEDDISATMEHGILHVRVPKVPEPSKPEPKRIAITAVGGTEQAHMASLEMQHGATGGGPAQGMAV